MTASIKRIRENEVELLNWMRRRNDIILGIETRKKDPKTKVQYKSIPDLTPGSLSQSIAGIVQVGPPLSKKNAQFKIGHRATDDKPKCQT